MFTLYAFARVYQPFDCLRFQVAAPRNSSLFEYIVDEQPIMIYAEVICKRALLPVEILLFFFLTPGGPERVPPDLDTVVCFGFFYRYTVFKICLQGVKPSISLIAKL